MTGLELLHWPGARVDATDESRSDSPFWSAVRSVVDGSRTVRVACPYLAPSYVETLADGATEWRLVTDVQAWTRVYGGAKETAVREFLRRQREDVRHYPGLHAKAVVGDETAVFGSANLTRNGMVERQELGVRLTDSERLAELHEWFDDLWATGHPVDDGVSPAEPATEESPDSTAVPDAFDRLRETPGRAWVESLLDVMREAIRVAKLGERDPRLVTSVAQDDRLVVIVNNRYVCGGFFDGPASLGVVLADGFEGVEEAVDRCSPDDYYRFSTRDGRDPHWVAFDRHPDEALTGLRAAWHSAIEREVRRGTRSQYCDHHDARAYRLIVDEAYRETVLDRLFA